MDTRRGVRNTGMHILEVSDELGPDVVRDLCQEARQLTDEHWTRIESRAERLAAGDDHGPLRAGVAPVAGRVGA